MCYSEHYVESTVQQVDSGIAVWMECVTLNIIWKIRHSKWTVVLQFVWNLLQLILCVCYCTAVEQCYCRLYGLCYSEHLVEGTTQQMDSGISG